jgi:DNA recombination protein RmuC
MDITVIVLAAALAAGAGAFIAWALLRRPASVEPVEPAIDPLALAEQIAAEQAAALQGAFRDALGTLQQQARADREAALGQLAGIAREQIGAQVAAGAADLSAKKDVIGTQLDQIKGEMRAELDRLGTVVATLSERSAHHFGQVDRSLKAHAEITQHLSTTTQSLREALANSKSRGQWGERMAEDVLRLAGFIENVNYRKQTAVEGDSRALPDFTFMMPKEHVLYMDVKFPLTSYLRYLDAGTDAERQAHRDQFLRDVRLRVRELARREYAKASDRATVDQVLLFLPNEALSCFILENDPTILEDAMKQNIVICSPVSLLAFLGLIRQAFDCFMIEQTSDQILALLGRFGEQWGKYTQSLESVKRRFDGVQKDFDQLLGTRKRALERPLVELEAIRRDKGLPVDGALFDLSSVELSSVDVDTRPRSLRDVRELGA